MVVITYCECIGSHEPDYILPIIFEIKEQVCRERGIVSYIPEEVAEEIDRRVEEEIARRRNL